MKTTRFIFLACLLISFPTHAAFVIPDWERGSEGSAYLEWESFNSRNSNIQTTPDVGSLNFDSTILSEHIGTAFVTSSGNLYSFSTGQEYTLEVKPNSNGPSSSTQSVYVMLQLSTWSRPVDIASVTLGGKTGTATELYTGNSTHPVFGNFTAYEYLFEWNVDATDSYKFAWNMPLTSTSLDAIVLDMTAVPLPATVPLILSGIVLLGFIGSGKQKTHPKGCVL